MSFARDRRLSGSSLGGVGVLGCRPVGCGGPPVRLPGPIFVSSSSFRCSHSTSQLLPVFHQGVSSHCYGSRSPQEGGHRTGPSFFSRLLQLPLCHSQSHQGLAACDRPLPPQPVCSCLSLPHGDSTVGPPVSASGGLDSFAGPVGCLPSGPSSPRILPFSEVLCGRGSLTVPRSLLRPFHRPAGVHACHGSDLVNHTLPRVPDLEVPQRLASPRVLLSEPGSGEGLPSVALPGTWCPGQLGKEFVDSDSILGLPGDAASDSSFEGFPDPKVCPEAQLSARRVHLLSAAASFFVAPASGGDFFPGFHRARVPSPNALSPTSVEFRQSPVDGFGQRSLRFFFPRGSSVAVRRRPSSCRPSSESFSARAFPVHRCFRFRLGGLSRRRPPFRLVVSPLLCLFHQPSGASCGPLRGSGISSSVASSVGQPVCGQHHRSGLPAESRGNSFLSPQFRRSGDPEDLRIPSDSFSPSIHPR